MSRNAGKDDAARSGDDAARRRVMRGFLDEARPAMDSRAVLRGDHWRIGVITDSLLRLEWSDDGVFEDGVTQVVVNRDFAAVPEFTVSERDGMLVLDTAHLHLVYDRGPFSREGLSVEVNGVATHRNTWRYGEDGSHGNLGSTARTLDEADGPIPLSPGVVSRDGWAMLDDSTSNVIDDEPVVDDAPNPFGAWTRPRAHHGLDLYVFGYGHRYIDAVRDFCRLTGPSPVLPRWALGNWWSRYHPYTQEEYLGLMDRFSREGIPFTTAVLDMDWHLVDVDPRYGFGWTGYTWNGRLFPDHRAFLRTLHERGMKITLNVHPRDGIRAYEKDYPAVARGMGVDPASQRAVEFDAAGPRFAAVYLDMHHRLESEGVDFWWIDWQQGGVSRQPGLDPLWMLNHLHYRDSAHDGHWPITFSRYAGPGSQRYPVGFSGDTVISWASLAFQPYFTATASNVGYGWWSHDIGGHMLGRRDGQLEARWYQFGAFSPISRLHSSNSPFSGKEPWNFEPEVRDSMVGSLRLRHRMIPYLHTMNHRACEKLLPLVEPMYWRSPEQPDAYAMPDEYRFGSELVVAPVVEPNDPAARRGRAQVWLPQGDWFDFFDGRRYASQASSGRRMELWRGLDRIPVLAKAGGIVPLQDLGEGFGTGSDRLNSTDNPRSLGLLVFPGADGSFTLREDDGRFGGDVVDTVMDWRWSANEAGSFRIAAAKGAVGALPDRRRWRIVFRGVGDERHIEVSVGGVPATPAVGYDPATLSLCVALEDVPIDSDVLIVFPHGLPTAADPWRSDAYDLLFHAEMPYLTKEQVMDAVDALGPGAVASLGTFDHRAASPRDLHAGFLPASVASALTEILLRG